MKRIISLLIVFSLVLIIYPKDISVANATDSSAEMSEVLLKVKEKIVIPNEYEKFTYQYSSENESGFWIFSWEAENGERIRVRADSKGRISNYTLVEFSWKENAGNNRAPQFTRVQAENKVSEFLKKTVPEAYNSLSSSASFYTSPTEGIYNFTYNRLENGIICENQWINVSINYITGKVEYMSSNWLYDAEYKKIDSPITENEAKRIWKENIKMQLKYLYKYDNDAVEAYLAYVPDKEIKEIDASNGEIIEKKFNWQSGSDNTVSEDMMESGALAGGGSAANKNNFTQDEINKLTQHENLLTLTQADNRVRAIKDISLEEDFAIASGNLFVEDSYLPSGKNTGINYVWHITYTEPVIKGKSPKTIYVDVDAKTGELKRYADYSEDSSNVEEKMKINENMAAVIAKRFIDSVAKEKTNSVLDNVISEKKLYHNGKSVNVGWEIFYKRGHNNIPVANDGLNVSVNKMTGKITHYSYSWRENIVFESAEGILDEKQALDAYIDNAQAKLEYHIITTYFYDKESDSEAVPDSVVKNKKSTVLVYRFDSPSDEISAKTGEYINVYKNDNKKFEGYTDIKGHWAEREIELLVNIGVLPQRKEFKAYNKISQEEFLTILYSSRGRAFSYDVAVDEKVIRKDEINRTGAVTRYQAIEIIASFLGYGKLAKDHSIFRVHFKDAGCIPERYLGSVAIGKAMGIISGNNGNYNGTSYLTNGEAAMMIYNTMLKSGEY